MRVVLAGGGTTGHIAPLIATAEALRRVDPAVAINCVGTPVGLEGSVIPAAGLTLDLVDPVPWPRRLGRDLVTLPFRLSRAVHQARAILARTGAEVVIGFGGYAALPVYLAAHRAKLPLVVHEANAVPGLANRIGARFATTTCVTFSNTGLPRQVVTGLPVRGMIAGLDRAAQRAPARQELGLPADGPVLLVSGGSQGAQALNQRLMAALPGLDAAGVNVLHLSGAKQADHLGEPPDLRTIVYRRLAYLDRMDQAYAAADLMLGRAGAGTVTETAMVGLPAIFVPFPHGNGEQVKNAASLVAAGAGRLIAQADLTPARLIATVSDLVTTGQLDRMGRLAAAMMPRDAAERVAQFAREAVG